MEYQEFLQSKRQNAPAVGFHAEELPLSLFPFQCDIARWMLHKGRAAAFADTGLGKSRMQVTWAHKVHLHTSRPVIIFCPLAVASQTIREGAQIGVTITLCKSQGDVQNGVNIANYDRLHLFTPDAFGGIALDESSILKSFTGATKQALIEFAAPIHYRSCWTATPAPNDHTEIGNHAEFLGVMTRTEMLATYFTHDGGDTSVWRLKGHAVEDFWRWVASWAVACRKPSDVGDYDDSGYCLPDVNMREHIVESGGDAVNLFGAEAADLNAQRKEKRNTLSSRVAKMAEIVASEPDEPRIIWCELNDEADAITAAIDGAVQVAGADSNDRKEQSFSDFASGKIRVLVTKPQIAGFGLNWQHCARVGFLGVTHSYESYYQSLRRCWRFGQSREVVCDIIYSEAERPVITSLRRKEKDATKMSEVMTATMNAFSDITLEPDALDRQTDDYSTSVTTGRNFTAYCGDCVETLRGMDSSSIDYSVFSPPFASLYTYSNSERDMGNVKNDEEFFAHFGFAVNELFRVLRPGRLVSFHCTNFPAMKERDGYIGIKDFRGDLIRMFESAGFIFHSEVVIWKDPVTAMQRTKALGLLHKTIVKDSAMSRQGIPDYLVTMRKPGDNPKPITGELTEFYGEQGVLPAKFGDVRDSINIWQRYASPVWMDINPSDTLQYMSARESEDERHICPLQLGVIRRCLQLWSNPGDVVFSPFMGIGSEGYVSLQMGRKFVGAELKRSYFNQAVKNLRSSEISAGQMSLMDME
jgi:hypothetical protein